MRTLHAGLEQVTDRQGSGENPRLPAPFVQSWSLTFYYVCLQRITQDVLSVVLGAVRVGAGFQQTVHAVVWARGVLSLYPRFDVTHEPNLLGVQSPHLAGR